MGKDILVLCLGNDILGDDIAGFLVADEVKKIIPEKYLDHIDIIKTSESGFKIIDYLIGYKHVIIVDSMLDDKAGEIIRIPLEKLPMKIGPSLHWMGIPEIIRYFDDTGLERPNIEIYAIVIRDIGFGDKVNEDVSKASKRLAMIIKKRLDILLKNI